MILTMEMWNYLLDYLENLREAQHQQELEIDVLKNEITKIQKSLLKRKFID